MSRFQRAGRLLRVRGILWCVKCPICLRRWFEWRSGRRRAMFERPRNVEAAQDEDRALPATCVLQDLRERGAEDARDWWTLPHVDWPPARGAAAPRTVLLSAGPTRRQSWGPALSGCATASLTRCSSADALLTVMCLLSEEAVAMSRGLTKANYSHCPLKKRPVYVTDSLDHTTGRLHI